MRALREHWVLILLLTVAAGVVAFALASSRPTLYVAETKLFFQDSELQQTLVGQVPNESSDRDTQNLATLVQSRQVAVEAAKRLGISGDVDDLAEKYEVRPDFGSDFVSILAEDGDAKEAALIANAVADGFTIVRRERVRRNIAAARASVLERIDRTRGEPKLAELRRSLQQRLQDLDSLAAVPMSDAEQVDRAIPPEDRASPRPVRTAFLGLGAGLLLSIALAYAMAGLDRRLRDLSAVERHYGAPVLTTMPHLPGPAFSAGGALLHLEPSARESMRSLRTNLLLSSLDRRIRTLLITSAGSGEGKSTIVGSLALVYAEAGARVVVVDADLRWPTLATAFGQSPVPGITEVLSERSELEDAIRVVPVETPGDRLHIATPAHEVAGRRDAANEFPEPDSSTDPAVHLLPAGEHAFNAPDILASERFALLLRSLADDHDIVLVDSAPLIPVSDTVPLVSQVDGVVVVTRLGQTSRTFAARARALLGRIPEARFLGIVANDDKSGGEGYSYRYGEAGARRRRSLLRRLGR